MENKLNFNDFKKKFLKGNINKKELLKELKVFFTGFETLLKVSNRFEKELTSCSNLLKQVLLGKNYLPKSCTELNKGDEQYFTDSLEQEMSWQSLAFLKCSDIINQFIKLKNEFEHNLLLGKYDKARVILEQIEKDICVSYWSIENKFILDEYQFGSEKNWETRNIILDEKNDELVRILGDMYSRKAEKRVSFFQYNDDFEGWELVQSQSIYGLNDEIQNYMRFKSNYFSFQQYQFLAEMLYREANASIIDRYLLFIRIAQHYAISITQQDESFVALLKNLNNSINDIFIEQILVTLDVTFCFKDKNCSDDILKIIDEYTKGNYHDSKKLSKEYLLSKSSNTLELCEIYAKSLVELNSEYEGISESDTFLNKICKVYFDILSKVPNTDDALVELVKLAYTFNNSHIGIKLYTFLKEELGWKTKINYSFLAQLNSQFINPKLLNILYNNKNIAKKFIENISKFYPKSETILFFKNFYDNILLKKTNKFLNIPLVKNTIYQAKNMMFLRKYNEAANRYLQLLNRDNLSKITQYKIFSNLFRCYLKINDHRNCIILYVNAYLENTHFTKKMNVNTILEGIVKEKFKNVGDKQNLIELPIFLKITFNDKVKIKQSYDLFLRANQCKKPSEIFKLKDTFENAKLIYFLKDVCTTEIMQLSTIFESTENVNAERIAICKFLAEFDTKNEQNYKIEIIDLTQKNTISQVIAGVDERKVYVNEVKIREYIFKPEKQNILNNQNSFTLTNEVFERYVTLLNYVKNNNEYKTINSIIHFEEDGNITYSEPERNKTYTKEDIDNVLYLPAFETFKIFFFYIRELFVFNKDYGLDAYLSTRIRHGTLPNHLRSVFETFMLVTAQTDGVYSDNSHWAGKLELSDVQMNELQRNLANFSFQVDDFAKTIKDKIVQCKTEKKNNELKLAAFDFSYSEKELICLFLDEFQDITSLDIFVEKIFIKLWRSTEECLDKVQNNFNSDIKDEYIKIIDDLQQKISYLDRHSIVELQNNLVSAKTEIQTKLSNISKWFGRSESSFDGEYELKILAETSIQITKNIHPNYHFELETGICENFNIRGEHHQHLIDLMNNCLFNIIKHSELTCENLNAKLSIQEKDNKLLMMFENCVANVEKHHTKLSKIKDNWINTDSNVSQEGGTGFPKIKKIIHSDLGRKQSDFSFSFDNNKLSITLSFETNELKV